MASAGSPAGRASSCRGAFSRLFRRLFLERLVAAHDAGRLLFFGALASLAARDAFDAYLAPLRKAEWVVYAKRPFGGRDAVLAYLSRYTHRVAIANSRLLAFDGGAVTFKWKDSCLSGFHPHLLNVGCAHSPE